MMKACIELENIEEMRQEAGIDDAGLREELRTLRAGDAVKLTARVATRASPGEYLLVRVTSVKGGVFRGKLERGGRLSLLKAGALLTFTACHIHSVASRRASAASASRPRPTEKEAR